MAQLGKNWPNLANKAKLGDTWLTWLKWLKLTGIAGIGWKWLEMAYAALMAKMAENRVPTGIVFTKLLWFDNYFVQKKVDI